MEGKAKKLTRARSVDHNAKKLKASLNKITDETTKMKEVEQWVEIVENLQVYLTKKKPMFGKMVKKGIPDYFRGYIWKASMPAKERKEFPHLYNDILKLCSTKEKHSVLIAKDVGRLTPIQLHQRVERGPWKEKVTNVLKAVATRFPEVGYVQGMAMIVRFCLAYMEEEDAFWFLVNLLESHGLKQVYMQNFPGLKKAFYVHLRLIKDYFPKVFYHFSKLGVKPSMYCSNWFMTLYSGSWPVELVARIWDVFFCDSSEIIHRIALTFIKFYQTKFLKLPFEEIIMYTRMPWENLSPDELLKTALSMASIEKKIQKYEEEQTRNPDPVIQELCE